MSHLPQFGHGAAVLAFDVGGTDIKSALVDENGVVRAVHRTATPVARLDPPVRTPGEPQVRGNLGAAPAIMERLRELRDGFASEYPDVVPEAVAVVAPGIVDSERGVGVFASNLGWSDAPIRELTEQALGVPAVFHHDIHSASLAELTFGAARHHRNALVVVLGTGIAATVIIDGLPYLSGGFAGEIGHGPIGSSGLGGEAPLCPCGARGCLETFASGGGIARRYRDRRRAAGYESETPDRVREILALADAGDEDARAVWNDALDALATSFAQVSALLAPEAIVLGGGLSRAGEALLSPLRERLDQKLSFHRRPQIFAGELGEDAGLIGSALFARSRAARGVA